MSRERSELVTRGVGAPAPAPHLGFRFFAAPAGQPRSRRGTDVVLLVPAVLGLALSIAAYPPSSLERSLESFLASLPAWLDPVWGFMVDPLWLWALMLIAIALLRVRLVVVGQAVAALGLAALLSLWSSRLAVGMWPGVADAIFGTAEAQRFPATRAAEATAVILTVSPHLARPVRAFGRWVLLLGLVGVAVTVMPLGLIAATAIAIAAAATVRLASGTSVGRPGLDEVAAGLAQLGIFPRELGEAERQVAGVFHVRGADEEGRALMVKALGREEVAELLPYLQSAALPASLRKALGQAGVDLDELRAEAAETVGAEAPELAKLRRVSVRALVQIALFGFVAYTILEAAGGVDWGDVLSTVEDASWAWIVFAFVVAQLPRLSQAVSTLGSVPSSMPFGPVYAMQLATGYMNVALPSNLARMAVNIRFFQRQGLTAPTAVASGVIDSFASTIVQGLLLGVLLIFSESSLALELPAPSGGFRVLLWVLVGALVACVLILVFVRRLREAIAHRVRRWWPDVRASLVALRASHKVALLLIGNLATELLFATALGLFARAFGAHVDLTELLVINISVSLLASFIPVPGGIGVAEFGLTIGLTSAGMTPEAAIAAVLLYRISTYYLPPAWGFPAMLWPQHNRYL